MRHKTMQRSANYVFSHSYFNRQIILSMVAVHHSLTQHLSSRRYIIMESCVYFYS